MDVIQAKRLWISTVKRIFQTDKYFVSKKFDKIFEKFVNWLSKNPHVDPELFVIAQIQYMIDHGLVSKLFPNVLIGTRAEQRYAAFMKNMTSSECLKQAHKTFMLQCNSFDRMCDYLGEHEAFSNTIGDFNPLVIVYQCLKRSKPVPDYIRTQAQLELYVKPWFERILPENLLQEVKK